MENRPDGKYTQLEMILAEEKAFAKFAAMRLANDDAISIPRIYFDMVEGDFPAAAVLDEILFWTLPNKKTGRSALRVRKDGILWLAVARSEWWERKRLTERQADRGIERLIELGLVEKSVHRYNGHAQTHLRVRGRQFFSLYGEALQKGYLEGSEEENPVRELSDLYAMMGMSDSPNGDSPNGDTESPKRDTNNILQPSSNQPPIEEDETPKIQKDPAFSVLIKAFEAFHGTISTAEMHMLGELLDDWRAHIAGHPDHPDAQRVNAEEVIMEAVKITAKNAENRRSMAYTGKIIRSWIENGYGWKPVNNKYPAGSKNPQPAETNMDIVKRMVQNAPR